MSSRKKTGALIGSLDDISFVETSHFLQKNFEMTGPQAEVIAVRLRETFTNFKLSAHPTYFAGIPANTLSALLRANKRAELIELAMAGYLSYVVALDDQPVALTRTTREEFLTSLSFEINVNKRSFTESELVKFTSDFAVRYDFKISPVKFISSFIEKSILYVDGDRVQFTLPFMEMFLLAKTLHKEPANALSYFQFRVNSFNVPVFTLYAELGASKEIVAALLGRLDQSIQQLLEVVELPPGLLSNDIVPALLSKHDKVASMQERLRKAIVDVTNDNDATHDKQKLLDAADKIRNAASQQSQKGIEEGEEKREKRRSVEGDALEVWYVSLCLLGAGAERLEASVKRALVAKTIKLSALILDDWTRESASVDYKEIKQRLLNDGKFISELSKSESEADMSEARRSAESLVDLLEYSLVSQPFRVVVSCLCEEARDQVLAESVVNTAVDGTLEDILKSIWLSDLDTSVGAKELKRAIKTVPNAKLLRMNVAAHLIMRVYWRHWNKESRLKLLDVAQESLKSSGLTYDKAGLQRLIERESGK